MTAALIWVTVQKSLGTTDVYGVRNYTIA